MTRCTPPIQIQPGDRVVDEHNSSAMVLDVRGEGLLILIDDCNTGEMFYAPALWVAVRDVRLAVLH